MELFNVQIRNKLQVLTCIDYENINWMSKTLWKTESQVFQGPREYEALETRQVWLSSEVQTAPECSPAYNELKPSSIRKQSLQKLLSHHHIILNWKMNVCFSSLQIQLEGKTENTTTKTFYTYIYKMCMCVCVCVGITKQCCLFKKKFILYKL